MAILDELKNKIGDKANKANNIQEAVAEMPILEPLYLVGDPTAFDPENLKIRTSVKMADALEAFKSGRRVIAKIDLRSIGQQVFYGDAVITYANYVQKQMGGMSFNNTKILVYPLSSGLDDTVAVLRIET